MKPSTIGWTDFSGGPLNFISGCTPISEGCQNCYARAMYERFGLDFTPRFDDDKLYKAINTSYGLYSPKRHAPFYSMCFVCDTGDMFHENIPDGTLWDILDSLVKRPDIVWQILTKRVIRMNGVVDEWLCRRGDKCLPPNIWLGVTAENQRRADERIPILLATPAAVRFVSIEPMLEGIDLTKACWGKGLPRPSLEIQACQIEHPISALDWVICGAESGPHRRQFDVRWAVDLYTQCKAAGVPFFYKQGSALRPGQDDDLPGIGKVKQWPK